MNCSNCDTEDGIVAGAGDGIVAGAGAGDGIVAGAGASLRFVVGVMFFSIASAAVVHIGHSLPAHGALWWLSIMLASCLMRCRVEMLRPEMFRTAVEWS